MIDQLSTALASRYEVEREIGAGGMATVHLARDLRHSRRVAIKVLRPELAASLGADRFLEEIRIAARLSHPHILPLHDSGSANGLLYYVMPFVEGESLRDRLQREGQLPLEDALRIAGEVADGLEYAHANDIVHRDIKPENILLSGSHALITDFGLATALSAAGGERLTKSGVTVGTPQYMSPEQAGSSNRLDARTDQYALGCVVYEMLTGEPPFEAPTLQGVMAKVLTQPAPPVREHRRSVPPHVEAAVARAMEKLPADRFTTVARFAEALRGERAVRARGLGPVAGTGRRLSRLGWPVAALAIAALALLAPWRDPVPPRPVARFAIPLDPGLTLDESSDGRMIAVSPTGDRVVFTAWDEDGRSRLYQRRLAAMATEIVPGTEGGRGPFFSPDGSWIGFFADGMLRKVSLRGGAPVDLAEVDGLRTASWSDDGTIVLSARGSGGGDRESLLRVPADGGAPEPASTANLFPRLSQEFHWHPEPLPGGNHILFTAWGLPGDSIGIAVRSVDTGEQRILLHGARNPRYLPTGHLLFTRGTDLYIAPFDPGAVEITGEAVVTVGDAESATTEDASFDVSPSGTLAYVPYRASVDSVDLVWVSPEGTVFPLQDDPGAGGLRDLIVQSPRVSPDGRRVLYVRVEDFGLWNVDVRRGVRQRITERGDPVYWVIWHPAGDEVLYNAARPGGGIGLFAAPADGRSGRRRLLSGELTFASPQSVAVGSGQVALLGARLDPEALARGELLDDTTGQDVWVLDLDDNAPPTPFLRSAVNEYHPAFSPDGRWLAFTSDRSGRSQVYVSPFPGPGSAIQLSTDGGEEPVWDPSGEVVYYRTHDGRQVMAVAVATDSLLVAEPPRPLFRGRFRGASGQWGRNYDIAPDGRFLMLRAVVSEGDQASIRVVLNWFQELEQLTEAANP